MSAIVRRRMHVLGIVQGVGFRPFIYRLATEIGLNGFVQNDSTRVLIEVEGSIAGIERFAQRLGAEAPPMAQIYEIQTAEAPCMHESGFAILASETGSTEAPVALIPPDRAVCDDCLQELFDPTDRRYRYPFITCTNCGPRFTIITRLPYDRSNTTMANFELCPDCAEDYADPTDRRHHAQPLACSRCGPHIWHERDGVHTTVADDALAAVQRDLAQGQVVAVKGLGGYHLAVDATNHDAVELLRHRKGRPDKPFAVMVPDLGTARILALIDRAEAAALQSPARPIVLLRKRDQLPLSSAVTPGNPMIGLMLAYTPLHHLLFRPIPSQDTPVPEAFVLTSGNVAGEPICFDDAEARSRLAALTDSFCTHNLPIRLPCDDSVVRLIDGRELPIRRSRGYAPVPVKIPIDLEPTLALGGDTKNTFCIAAGHNAWMSQHLGDMENLETLSAFESSIALLSELHQTQPKVIAVDAHPRYRTHRWGHARNDGRSVVDVQHHHAHLAALMAESGIDGKQATIGFVFDGTGYGTDGGVWGGEVLIADYTNCERWGNLAEVTMPGGDAAVRNPCRMALAHMSQADIAWDSEIPSVRACDETERHVLAQQLSQGTGCSTTTSMGRLFDAVASLLDLRHRITYEAQAAIALEALATNFTGLVPAMRFGIVDSRVLDPAPLLRSLVEQVLAGANRAALARAFHEAVAEAVVVIAQAIRAERSLNVVGLTGGVFQNATLTRAATTRLSAAGFKVITHRLVPPNDGGLALGQAMIAAHAANPHPSRSSEAAKCA